MIQNRIQRFSKIRRWLGRALDQKPDADMILSQMLVDEQAMLNKLTNTGQPWSLSTSKFRTNPGQSDYIVEAQDGQPGKVYFVTQDSDDPNEASVPVEYSDYNDTDFYGGGFPSDAIEGSLPATSGVVAARGRVAFYRSGGQSQEIRARLTPAPSVSSQFTVTFFTAAVDWSNAMMEQSTVVAELSDYVDLKSALALLPYAMWRSEEKPENVAYNSNRRREIALGLQMQLAELRPIIDDYIRQINAPTTFEMPYWNE